MTPHRLVAALALLLACSQPAKGPAPGASCAEACARIRECALGPSVTPRGVRCEEVCTAVAAEGADFGATCLVEAKTCEEARHCQ